jgi:hypothetical protein
MRKFFLTSFNFLISYSLFLILTFRNFSLSKAGYFIAAFNPSVVV